MTSTKLENSNDTSVRIGDRVSIRRRGKRGIYCAEFRVHGHHRRRSLKTFNLKIARQRAILIEAELAGGEYAAPAKPISVTGAQKFYMDAIRAAGRARKTIVAYDAETKSFAKFLEKQGVHTLQEITPAHFLAYRAQLQKTLADKTLYTRLIVIKSFMNWCSGDGALLDLNPLRHCKVRQPYVTPKFTPTPVEVNAILGAAVGARLAQFATLAFAGLRVTELSMLRMQDVNLQQGWIKVVGRDGWMPKTRQARQIPVHPRLREILNDYLKSIANISNRSYFFCDQPDGSYPINVRTINVELQAVAQKQGVVVGRKSNGLVVHSMRHYFETQAVDSNVPQFVLDAWMGHAGQALMGRRYYGMTDQKSCAFMQQIKF